jgi:hypothetical protein
MFCVTIHSWVVAAFSGEMSRSGWMLFFTKYTALGDWSWLAFRLEPAIFAAMLPHIPVRGTSEWSV